MGSSFSVGNWADVKRQATTFQYFVPGYGESFNLAGAETPENVDGARVGADYFAMLGVQPAIGPRLPRRGGDRRDGTHVVMLSDGLWRRRFGADPSVVGHRDPAGRCARTPSSG